MKRVSSILILGGDADGNLGDRAILQSICQEMGDLLEHVEIYIVSTGRIQLEDIAPVRVIPRGVRGLVKLCVAAARSNLVICGGGGLFQDDDSLVKMPYWGLRVGLMRLLCPRVVGYSLGVGPLRAWSSRVFARFAFACMERVSVRDPLARSTAQALTHKTVQMVPDPALLLHAADRETARQWLRERGVPLNGQSLIGFVTRRWFPARYRLIPQCVAVRLKPHPRRLGLKQKRYIALLAQTLDRIARRHKAHVLFLPTYNLPHEGDDQVCEEISAVMSWDDSQILRIEDPALYKAVVRELDVLVAGRMHPTIFAASVGTPIVGLSYNQKFLGFFELLGLQKRVVDVEKFIAESLVEELCDLVEDALRERGVQLTKRTQKLAEQVQQFNCSLLEKAT